MAQVPDAARDQARAELGLRMDRIRWEEISSSRASALYDEFVDDPKIGGVLKPFLPVDKIRVWIKDGPAKEYRRALEGVGYMAAHTSRAYPGPDALIAAALGEGWRPDSSTVEEKPMRCLALHDQDQTMLVVWGPLGALQGVYWVASTHRARNPDQPATMVFTKPSHAPLSGREWDLARRLADVIDVNCVQVTYAVGKKVP